MISFYHINDECVLKTCHVNPNWHFVIASTKVILKKKKKEFSSMRSAGKKEASFANYNLASIISKWSFRSCSILGSVAPPLCFMVEMSFVVKSEWERLFCFP